jgi:hypothetical protein
MTNKKAIENYNTACNDILELFAIKQDLDTDGWVADDIGTICGFGGSYFFTMEDMVVDIKKNCPKKLITQWQDDTMEYNRGKEVEDYRQINYESYARGLRFDQLKEKIKETPFNPIDIIEKMNDHF